MAHWLWNTVLMKKCVMFHFFCHTLYRNEKETTEIIILYLLYLRLICSQITECQLYKISKSEIFSEVDSTVHITETFARLKTQDRRYVNNVSDILALTVNLLTN